MTRKRISTMLGSHPSRLFGSVMTIALLFPPASSRADLLYFANGGRIQHPAVIEKGIVRLDTVAGRFEFPVGDFREIVPGFDPAAEWSARSHGAREGSVEDRLTAAWWALENGLITESTSMIREANTADPKHRLAARLAKTLDRLEAPGRDPDTSALLEAVDVGCEITRGLHVLLYHQHGAAEAQERVDLLEKVYVAYFLLLTWQGVEVQVPFERLPSVYLKERSDYLKFLDSQHARAFSGTFGYYHPTLRAMIAHDLRSSGKLQHERATIARLTAESRSFTEDRRRDLQRRQLLFEMDYRALDHGTAAHEMVHQLVVSSGLAPDSTRFPQWLHEGLAAQFEVIRGGRWAGIGRAHDLRLEDWRKVADATVLLAVVRDEGYGHGYRPDVYAKSWALVYFLQKKHPERFWAFLDRLRDPDPSGSLDPKRFAAPFQAGMGDPNLLESEWRAFMTAVATPLEDHLSRNDPPVPSRIPPSRD